MKYLRNITDGAEIFQDIWWYPGICTYCTVLLKAGFSSSESHIPDYGSTEARLEIGYLRSIGFLQEEVDFEALKKDRPTRIVIGRR